VWSPDCPQPSPKARVLIAALLFPFAPPSFLSLAVSAGWRQGRVLNADQAGKSGSPDVRHERDRPLAMSCESVASGATQNQLPIAAGISAKQATNIHLSGRSTARIMPTIATVATHVDNTRSFR